MEKSLNSSWRNFVGFIQRLNSWYCHIEDWRAICDFTFVPFVGFFTIKSHIHATFLRANEIRVRLLRFFLDTYPRFFKIVYFLILTPRLSHVFVSLFFQTIN